MSIDTSKLNRYKPGYVHSNDGPGYISMLAREDGEYVRLEDVIAITIALEQALTQQRGEFSEVGNWLWVQLMDWCRSQRIAPATKDKLFGIVERARKQFPATTPQPSADAVRELVKRWRKLSVKSHRDGQYQGYDTLRLCADELESLLSAANDHQQNAAQGGGEK